MTISISLEQPETFDAGGATFRVLDDGSSTSGRIGVVEGRLAPGWAGPPQHVHREHDETFFIVTGVVRFTSATDSLIAGPGRVVTAPIGAPHTFANADDQAPASLLCVLTPQRYIDYFRELCRLTPGTDGRLDPAEVLAVMARYATEPYRPQARRARRTE
jgi:mannose-6-phosphate isomerase-like protein (cupin superfamily)